MMTYLDRPDQHARNTAIAPTFQTAIAICPKDIDQMGHVNNSVYLQWVQETVTRYWTSVAPDDATATLLWVALKHEVTYHAPLFLDDCVTAYVTATAARGSRASFSTLIMRGNTLAAEINSAWCCIDATTRRPRRLARDIVQLFLPDSHLAAA